MTQTTNSNRLTADTFKELKTGDTIVYLGHTDGDVADDLTVGKSYEVWEGFGEDVMALVILGGAVKFTDDANDDCMLHDVNCLGFAKGGN